MFVSERVVHSQAQEREPPRPKGLEFSWENIFRSAGRGLFRKGLVRSSHSKPREPRTSSRKLTQSSRLFSSYVTVLRFFPPGPLAGPRGAGNPFRDLQSYFFASRLDCPSEWPKGSQHAKGSLSKMQCLDFAGCSSLQGLASESSTAFSDRFPLGANDITDKEIFSQAYMSNCSCRIWGF